MGEAVDMEKVGLRPREMQVLRAAAWARTQVPNGHYLCGAGQTRAAERMIERGFLTKAPHGFTPPAPGWLVVLIDENNFAALKAAQSSHKGCVE